MVKKIVLPECTIGAVIWTDRAGQWHVGAQPERISNSDLTQIFDSSRKLPTTKGSELGETESPLLEPAIRTGLG